MLTCFWSDLRQAFAAAERSWELQGVYLGPLSLEARTTRPNAENGLTGRRRIRIFPHLRGSHAPHGAGTSCSWTRRPSRPSTSGAPEARVRDDTMRFGQNKVEQQIEQFKVATFRVFRSEVPHFKLSEFLCFNVPALVHQGHHWSPLLVLPSGLQSLPWEFG